MKRSTTAKWMTTTNTTDVRRLRVKSVQVMGNVTSYHRRGVGNGGTAGELKGNNINILSPTTGVTFMDSSGNFIGGGGENNMIISDYEKEGSPQSPNIGGGGGGLDSRLQHHQYNKHHTASFVRNRNETVSMRSSKYSPKNVAPMPTSEELEKRFTKVLVSYHFYYFFCTKQLLTFHLPCKQ